MKTRLICLVWTFVFCCQAKMEQDNMEMESEGAEVTDVQVSGESGHYQFSVTLSTPDRGCEQYADWWEVVSASGDLLYRRILMHSHVDAQPFTRSGGPVAITEEDKVWVRVHMNNTGYSAQVMEGTVGEGFESRAFPEDFASGLEEQVPLPDGCRF